MGFDIHVCGKFSGQGGVIVAWLFPACGVLFPLGRGDCLESLDGIIS